MANKQFRSKKHMDFIRKQRCCICGATNVEAHHLLRPWRGHRGMSMKSGDENLVPLCVRHHRELHHYGDEDSYWKEVDGQTEFGRRTAYRLWLASPHYEELD